MAAPTQRHQGELGSLHCSPGARTAGGSIIKPHLKSEMLAPWKSHLSGATWIVLDAKGQGNMCSLVPSAIIFKNRRPVAKQPSG